VNMSARKQLGIGNWPYYETHIYSFESVFVFGLFHFI
jgi:hypothetical protein